MSEGRNGRQPFWKISVQHGIRGLTGARADSGRDAPRRGHDRRVREVGDGGDDEQEGREMAESGRGWEAAGRRSGRLSATFRGRKSRANSDRN